MRKLSHRSESKLSQYLATTSAAGVAAAVSSSASQASAAIVANTTPVPFGINEEVDIDFNGDGVADFQIDHDRVNIDGTDIDYLQLDKNDFSSAADPLGSDAFAVFPGTYYSNRADYSGDNAGSWDQGDLQAWHNQYGTSTDPDEPDPNFSADGNGDFISAGEDFLIWQQQTNVPFSFDQAYLTGANEEYPTALSAGSSIGPSQFFTFQESENFQNTGLAIHANRLIDEDQGTIDTDGGVPAFPIADKPGFVGLGGETRYLGVRMDINDEGFTGNGFPIVNGPDDTDVPANYWYGWIGVQITNEADATGVVTGWAYEDQIGTSILAGDTGALSASSAVPEPNSILITAVGGVTLASGFAWRRLARRGPS